MKRWPRKNDPESIDARQKALGLSDGVTKIDLSPFVAAQEMLTGAAVIPVSVVGPLQIELGEYELEEPFGRVSETGRVPPTRCSFLSRIRKAVSPRRCIAGHEPRPSRGASEHTCSRTESPEHPVSSASRRKRPCSLRGSSTRTSPR